MKKNKKFKSSKKLKLWKKKETNFINKKILYLRGNYITLDIVDYFRNRLKIDEFLLYDLSYYKDFSDEFKHNLKNENISSIAFYSYKSLENFLNIIQRNKLDNYLKSINAYVMNQRSSDIGSIYFTNVLIINSEKILEILRKFCK